MSALLHYPRSSCSIINLAKSACSQSSSVESYSQSIVDSNLNINSTDAIARPKQALILPDNSTPTVLSLPKCTIQEHRTLSTLSHSIGGAGTMALAELYDFITPPDLYGNLNTFAGGGSAAAMANASHILKTISEYDAAVKAREGLTNHSARPNTVMPYKRRERKAFKKMSELLDRKGQQLLHKHAFKTRRTRNLTGRIVRESIPVSSIPEVKRLERLARAGRVLGPGLVVLDGGLRAKGVYKQYKANDPGWKREAVVQSAGFVMGLGSAGLIGGAVLMIVPGGFLLAIVAGGIAALATDAGVQKIASTVYDKVIN